MTTPQDRDDELESALRTRRRLVPRFDVADDAEPSSELDRLVLARARDALYGGPASSPLPAAPRNAPERHYRAPRWAVPFALVATVLLSFVLVMQLDPARNQALTGAREAGEFGTDVGTDAPLTAATQSAPAAPAASAAPAPPPPPAPAPAPAGSRAPAAAAASAAPSAPPAPAPASAESTAPAAPTMTPVLVMPAAPTRSVAPAASPVARAATAAPAKSAAATAAEGSDRVSAANTSGQEAAAGQAAASAEATMAAAASPATPSAWLARIERLQQAGELDAARAQLAAFRRRFPDHPLPATLEALR